MMESTFYSNDIAQPLHSDKWPELIERRGYKAIIFDCDGTLVESANAHFNAFQTAAMAQGYAMERSWYSTKTGLDRRSTLEFFARDISGPFDVTQGIDDSIKSFISGAVLVSAIKVTVDLLDRYAQSHPIGVVTNAERQVAEASLDAIGVRERVKHLVSISDGLPPKPAPDLFAWAALKMAIEPNRIIVFEDSLEGVKAALAAGMDVVRLVPKS